MPSAYEGTDIISYLHSKYIMRRQPYIILCKQYIIELKIWRGNAYNERGEQQIAGYLDYFHAQTGYLLSFCFNKNKQPGVKTVQIDDKTIVECVV